MNNNYIISVENVCKNYRIYLNKAYTLKERFISHKINTFNTRNVIKDISFNIKRGEAVGIVGHNGCGKSTILKMLAKILYPDFGQISVSGKVSSLIELGAGFHPDLTGRENIYINASIYGCSKKYTDSVIDSIIDFSELGQDIDVPIRTYSSGMYMRLAFSVAINVNADILLIDEILSVGDMAFQKKCFDKLLSLKENGITIIIVSHDLTSIEKICDRSIWINDGIIVQDGPCQEVHKAYSEYMLT